MLGLYIQWFERKPDFTPDYDKEHHGTIRGNTPEECMYLYRQFQNNHDIAKYTRTEIAYVF